jgi:hypothetical protein
MVRYFYYPLICWIFQIETLDYYSTFQYNTFVAIIFIIADKTSRRSAPPAGGGSAG